jgi:CspA family cold shock protein
MPSSTSAARVVTHAGTVAWFNQDKGWGFITPESGDEDIFVHYTGISPTKGKSRRNIAQGDRVTFETITVKNGDREKLQAVAVVITQRAEALSA